MSSPHLDKKFGKISDTCQACKLGKQARTSFSGANTRRETRPGRKLHSDLCGPFKETGYDGSRYILSLVDDCLRVKKVFTLEQKSEAAGKIIAFIRAAKRRWNWEVAAFRTDRGGELLNAELGKFFEQEGIKHEYTPAYTPQLNGVAERFNRTLLDRVRCLFLTCNVSKAFWPEAVKHSCVVLNRTPHSRLGGKSPLELMTGREPSYSMLRVFGCQAFVNRLPKPDKLDARAYLAVYLGYDPDQHCHRVWDQERDCVALSRDVTFDENQFPRLSLSEEDLPGSAGTSNTWEAEVESSVDSPMHDDLVESNLETNIETVESSLETSGETATQDSLVESSEQPSVCLLYTSPSPRDS